MTALARRQQRATNIWPGFVDALATLLMVILFLLLIFVVAQFFLGHALSGRDAALKQLETEISELANILGLEQRKSQTLQASVSQLTTRIQATITERDELRAQIAGALAERDDLKIKLAQIRLRAEGAEQQTVEAMVALEVSRSKIRDQESALARQSESLAIQENDLSVLRARLARLEVERATRAEALALAGQQAETDRETIRLKLSEIALLNRDLAALRALRDELVNKVLTLGSQADERGKALVTERQLSESSRAQVALLNQQLTALREQLANLRRVLEIKELEAEDKDVQIANLGKRLNAALASKVQELRRFRSEFFGRLREVLGNRPGVRVAGDRFVFQSEVLFDVGSAELGTAGKAQMRSLAQTLSQLAAQIPDGIDWVLRVDGHTDKTPIATFRFPSNWELSSARAISVVKFLIENGVPAERLVAAGFGANRPIDAGGDKTALSRNRRIELKLTQR